MIIDLPREGMEDLRLAGSPLRFSASPVEYRSPPPRVGQYTETILRDLLGMDEAALDRLRAAAVI
jgi:crotonobetainyl-CoA:carnitine CoA-transferase CaiB-like acyl-CoA transferase